MPSDEVMHNWKAGKLHSGSKTGPVVKDQNQAVAIMMSEKREEAKHGGKYPEKKGYKKGGEVTSSHAAHTQNLVETVANSTGHIKLKKGGQVEPASRTGWKRWGAR
jgi:hypothetical protein